MLASAANSFVSPRTEECLAVVGDCIAKEVSLVSAKQVCFPDFCWHTFCLRVEIILLPLKVVVGRTGLPVARSPLVATLIESLVDPCHVAILSNMDWIPSSLKTCEGDDRGARVAFQLYSLQSGGRASAALPPGF